MSTRFVAAKTSDKTKVVSGLSRKPIETDCVRSGGKVRVVRSFPTKNSPVRWVNPGGKLRLVSWLALTLSVSKRVKSW